jgi:protein subunit release factor B
MTSEPNDDCRYLVIVEEAGRIVRIFFEKQCGINVCALDDKAHHHFVATRRIRLAFHLMQTLQKRKKKKKKKKKKEKKKTTISSFVNFTKSAFKRECFFFSSKTHFESSDVDDEMATSEKSKVLNEKRRTRIV